MLTSVKFKVGSGFCPLLCVRRLAECDASLVVKATSTTLRFPLESSTCVVLFLSPQNLCGFAGTPVTRSHICRLRAAISKSSSVQNDWSKILRNTGSILGILLRWGYHPTFWRNCHKPPTTPRHRGHGRGITAEPEKKNATMHGCYGIVCNVAIFIYGRDQNQYLPFFLVTMLGIAFFASFTVRREIPFPSAARNTFSAMIS